MDISEEEILEIKKMSEESEASILFSLGVGVQYEYAPSHINFSIDYDELGKDFWDVLQSELYALICDDKEKVAKDWAEEVISGEIRGFIVAVLTLFMATYNVSLGIAIPVVALLVKKGVKNFCKNKPKRKNNVTVKSLLAAKKKAMKEFFIVKRRPKKKK